MTTSSSTRDEQSRKSILKTETAREEVTTKTDAPRTKKKTARFNEENIELTNSPANKDYGFDKITEPDTPYEREAPPIDPEELNKLLKGLSQDEEQEPSTSGNHRGSDCSATSEGALSFEEKRKKHIKSEFKVARQADREANP